MSEHDFDGITADEKLAARKRAAAAAAERGDLIQSDTDEPAEAKPARARRQTTRA